MDERVGVENEFPVTIVLPPVEAAYQLMVPLFAVAPNVTKLLAQLLAGVVEATVGILLIVIFVLELYSGQYAEAALK